MLPWNISVKKTSGTPPWVVDRGARCLGTGRSHAWLSIAGSSPAPSWAGFLGPRHVWSQLPIGVSASVAVPKSFFFRLRS